VTLERASRLSVLSRTLFFGMSYVLAIVTLHRWYLVPRIRSREMSMAMAIALVQLATITAMLSFSFFLKLNRQLRESRLARVAPRIRELLALHAAGSDRSEELRRLSKAYPREVEQCVVEFLRLVRGRGREALSQIAVALHLIHKWQRQYRSRSAMRRKSAVAHLALAPRKLVGDVLLEALLDPDESVRLHTARSMITNLEPGELAQIFGLAVNGPLVARMILAEDLRPYALDLAKDAIPAVLTSGVTGLVVATLDMLRAWGKFLPLPELYPLLGHPEPRIRAAALDVLHLVPRLPQLETEILQALNDPAEEVRTAAARTAASIGISGALPLLARRLHDRDARTAAAAAQALAQLGADGCRILEQEMVTGSLLAASAALEALERVQISPVETAAVG
jgi:hypothetical protein